jgi:hypothetical protein
MRRFALAAAPMACVAGARLASLQSVNSSFQVTSRYHLSGLCPSNMQLTAGILIAGSLHWREVPHRIRWRDAYLRLDGVTAVDVPLRYGRLSGSRTYTMVYAPGTPPGRAKAVPCKHTVSSAEELVAQAAALWAAEQSGPRDPRPGELHSATWGCVALLPNPSRNIPSRLLDGWAQRTATERSSRDGTHNYDPAEYAVKGQAAINTLRGVETQHK